MGRLKWNRCIAGVVYIYTKRMNRFGLCYPDKMMSFFAYNLCSIIFCKYKNRYFEYRFYSDISKTYLELEINNIYIRIMKEGILSLK